MTTFIEDIVQAYIEERTQSYIDDLIEDFLNTTQNGFLPSTIIESDDIIQVNNYVYQGPDATSGDIFTTGDDGTTIGWYNLVGVDATSKIYTTIDSTSPTITVLQWKQQYWETDVHRAARRNQGEIITWDNASPQYPLPDWDSLTNSVFDSGGLTYDSSSYIVYELNEESLIDRVAVYCDETSSNVYFAYSKNGTDWTYLKAEADHTLDSQGRLVSATDSTDAVTNYWTMSAIPGEGNVAKFPLGTRAKYLKIFIETDNLTIYELMYRFYVIPEQMVVDYLSALTADVGLLTAGVIQSTNFDDGGLKMDLDNDVMEVYDANDTLRVKLGKLT